jgi:hypothetical protein
MRKTLLALSAATVIAAGTIAAPTPSHANGAAVAAIVAGGVLATVVVVDALAQPAYGFRPICGDRHFWWGYQWQQHRHRWHHRWDHRRHRHHHRHLDR